MNKFTIILAATALAATAATPAMAWTTCKGSMAQCPDPQEEVSKTETPKKEEPQTWTVPNDPDQWWCKPFGDWHTDMTACFRESDGQNVLCRNPHPGLPQTCRITGYVRNGVLQATPYGRKP
jgi:hypothetical protein